MIRVTVLKDESQPGIAFDLHRFHATLAPAVTEAIVRAVRERIDPAFDKFGVSQCDVTFNLDPLTWFGGSIKWDCLFIVEKVEAAKTPLEPKADGRDEAS